MTEASIVHCAGAIFWMSSGAAWLNWECVYKSRVNARGLVGSELRMHPRFVAPVCGTTAAGTSAEKAGRVLLWNAKRSFPLNDESIVARMPRLSLFVLGTGFPSGQSSNRQ